jgi:hypothetical protein
MLRILHRYDWNFSNTAETAIGVLLLLAVVLALLT